MQSPWMFVSLFCSCIPTWSLFRLLSPSCCWTRSKGGSMTLSWTFHVRSPVRCCWGGGNSSKAPCTAVANAEICSRRLRVKAELTEGACSSLLHHPIYMHLGTPSHDQPVSYPTAPPSARVGEKEGCGRSWVKGGGIADWWERENWRR
ncbi:hypothetical protein B0H67DRAFT_591445 [Lasiosphaeris hirsuta]|uniref:Secreted protein n=1 Tax=Lasiosphaeris hirsuta TaxID=260670 RepID=A0AA40DIH6_9PEZI|nr:hypothetical protein B0H67DRAFT_591445 [Lasiosphaeris hirsuta]